MKSPNSPQDSDLGLPLKSVRLHIRLFTLEDEQHRQQWVKFTDPWLAKYNFAPRSPQATEVQFERLQDRLRLALENDQGELIGYVSLKPVKRLKANAELGICLAANQVNKGYGYEALTMLLPWFIENLRLAKILLEVDTVNERAIRLYQRLGFQPVDLIWKKEDCSQLREYLTKAGSLRGFRWSQRSLEVQRLVMSWTTQH